MNLRRIFLHGLWIAGTAGLLLAESPTITWHTVDGGGGSCSNTVYALIGTIGQPDATPALSNATYRLSGGFFPLPIAIQTPGAPFLNIVRTGPAEAIISWVPDEPGWVLQETESLTTPSWTNAVSASTNPVVVPVPVPVMYYRLHKP